MKSEKDKMLAGELYDPGDDRLVAERSRARLLLKALNDSGPGDKLERGRLLRDLFAAVGEGTSIEPPFYCDYGSNITLGAKVFFNFNCVVLDVARVTIGNNVLFGPMVQVYTATHPMNADVRRKGLELGEPIEIDDDVWIGGGAIVCPGVRIGTRAVIGAGSVVTKDVPEGVFAAGNPCRVVRELNG